MLYIKRCLKNHLPFSRFVPGIRMTGNTNSRVVGKHRSNTGIHFSRPVTDHDLTGMLAVANPHTTTVVHAYPTCA